METHIEKELLTHARIEDFPQSMQQIINLIGLENLYKLSKYYANGSEIYIPVPERLLQNVRNKMIQENYNGYNERELAIRYGITVKQIKNILKAKYKT